MAWHGAGNALTHALDQLAGAQWVIALGNTLPQPTAYARSLRAFDDSGSGLRSASRC